MKKKKMKMTSGFSIFLLYSMTAFIAVSALISCRRSNESTSKELYLDNPISITRLEVTKHIKNFDTLVICHRFQPETEDSLSAFENLYGDRKFIRSLVLAEHKSIKSIFENDESVDALVLLARSPNFLGKYKDMEIASIVIAPVRNSVIELKNGDLVIFENVFREVVNEFIANGMGQ